MSTTDAQKVRAHYLRILRAMAADRRMAETHAMVLRGDIKATIREAYASGMTYQSIGEAVGLTRQRVAKICETRKGEE